MLALLHPQGFTDTPTKKRKKLIYIYYFLLLILTFFYKNSQNQDLVTIKPLRISFRVRSMKETSSSGAI